MHMLPWFFTVIPPIRIWGFPESVMPWSQITVPMHYQVLVLHVRFTGVTVHGFPQEKVDPNPSKDLQYFIQLLSHNLFLLLSEWRSHTRHNLDNSTVSQGDSAALRPVESCAKPHHTPTLLNIPPATLNIQSTAFTAPLHHERKLTIHFNQPEISSTLSLYLEWN